MAGAQLGYQQRRQQASAVLFRFRFPVTVARGEKEVKNFLDGDSAGPLLLQRPERCWRGRRAGNRCI